MTFGFLIGAWLFAPDALFQQGIEDTKVFLSDFERGRMDKTHHPFMTKFSLGDVRIRETPAEHPHHAMREGAAGQLHRLGRSRR